MILRKDAELLLSGQAGWLKYFNQGGPQIHQCPFKSCLSQSSKRLLHLGKLFCCPFLFQNIERTFEFLADQFYVVIFMNNSVVAFLPALSSLEQLLRIFDLVWNLIQRPDFFSAVTCVLGFCVPARDRARACFVSQFSFRYCPGTSA